MKNQIRSKYLSEFSPSTFPVLEYLELSNNKVTHLDAIGKLVGLNYLMLDDNKIQSISDLQGLSSLKRLSLRYNLLEKSEQNCPAQDTKACDFKFQEV